MAANKGLRLYAQDADDLAIISAGVQDGLAQLKDLTLSAKARQFTVEMNRFRWETVKANGRGPYERVRSALWFDSVIGARAKNLKTDAPGAVVSLLSIAFEPEDLPGGVVTLTFSGGAELRLDVECLEATLMDFGAPWHVKRGPDHQDDK